MELDGMQSALAMPSQHWGWLLVAFILGLIVGWTMRKSAQMQNS
ncbi:MAG: hypothetical protein ACR2OM_08430 [Aestuariivirgaceae bacterium]